MKITYTKNGDWFLVKARFEDGSILERSFPAIAIKAIMTSQGLTEAAAVDYIAVHQWCGINDRPLPGSAQAPAKAPTKPPAVPRPPPKPPVPPAPVAAPKTPPKVPAPKSIPKPAPPPPAKDPDAEELMKELADDEEEEDEDEGEEDEEEEEEEEPSEEDWEDYDWLMEQARKLDYFSRPGVQSKKKEDLQKWLRKKLKK